MTDQTVEPSTNDQGQSRDAEGKWLTGFAPNPEGKNGHNKGWQRYSQRVQRFLDMPVEDLRRLAKTPSEVKKLSSIDAICLRHVVNSMSGFSIHAERESLLDRIEGKAKNTTILQNPNGTPLTPVMAIVTPADGALAYQEALRRASEPAE